MFFNGLKRLPRKILIPKWCMEGILLDERLKFLCFPDSFPYVNHFDSAVYLAFRLSLFDI